MAKVVSIAEGTAANTFGLSTKSHSSLTSYWHMTMIGAPSTDAIVNRCDFTPDFPPPDNSNEFALPIVVLLKLKLK